jgi:hypothetical protein
MTTKTPERSRNSQSRTRKETNSIQARPQPRPNEGRYGPATQALPRNIYRPKGLAAGTNPTPATTENSPKGRDLRKVQSSAPARAISPCVSTGSAKQLMLLSLDGGGVKGLSSLLILKDIMGRHNRLRKAKALPHQKPCEAFDMIGGTSTGGYVFDAGFVNWKADESH